MSEHWNKPRRGHRWRVALEGRLTPGAGGNGDLTGRDSKSWIFPWFQWWRFSIAKWDSSPEEYSLVFCFWIFWRNFWRLLTHSPLGDRSDRIICITASAWGYESFWHPVWHHSRCPPVLPLAMESQGGRTWLIFMWYAWMVKDGRLNLVIPLWGGKCTGWFPSTSQSRSQERCKTHSATHWFTFDTSTNVDRAGNCGKGSNAFVHVCSKNP